MSNKPYDFFGTWYNDNYLLSGDLRWLAHLVSTSVVWLNRASQESDSEFTSIMNRMFKFYNRSASSIRSITVANCRSLPQRQPTSSSPTPSNTSDDCSSNKVFLLDRLVILFDITKFLLCRVVMRREIPFRIPTFQQLTPRQQTAVHVKRKTFFFITQVRRNFTFSVSINELCYV